jgi:uncharacterized membrane protein YdjX (TVP38/TMEM64 family)
MAAVGALYRDELKAFSGALVETFGGPGVAGAWLVLDFFPGPVLPQDLFTAFALLGGMGFWETAAWASLGSLSGASLGWLAARRLARHPAYLWSIQRGAARRVYHLVERNRALTLAVGAISPLPFSVAVWACTATGIRYRQLLLLSLLRPVRIIFYMWLMEIGAINALA